MKAVQASRRYAVRPVPLAFLRGYVGVAVSVEAMRRLKVYSSVQTNLDTAWHFLNLAPICTSRTFPLCISITSIGNVGKDICEGVERQNKRYACHTIHIIDVGMCSRLVRRIALAVSMYIVLFFFIYTISAPSRPPSLSILDCTTAHLANQDALKLSAELMRCFVLEAAHRAGRLLCLPLAMLLYGVYRWFYSTAMYKIESL